MNNLVLNKMTMTPTVMGTKVTYEYDAPECLIRHIKGDALFVEFPGDISGIPESILAIPFVGIMLTVGILFNINIRVPVLDRSFYQSMYDVQAVFQKMYPRANLRCRVQADCLTDTPVFSGSNTNQCSLFFTGGVDATSALAETVAQKPLLINVWGGDLRLTDNDSHEELEHYLSKLTAAIGLDFCFIKTNAREMFEENALGYLCEKLLGHRNNHGWWASIAHIVSMSSTIAPFLWLKRISVHYIGSSYDPSAKTFDSNNSTLLNALASLNCRFVPVDESINRNDKVGKIVSYQKETEAPIKLKVCWNRSAGENCSACEKCYRTILNLIANRADPNQYGFSVDHHTINRIKQFVCENTVSSAFWLPIQKSMISEYDIWKDTELAWFLDVKLNSIGVYARKLRKKLFHR